MRPFITTWVVILSSAITLQAQVGAGSSATTNSLTLEECVRQAVEHNLQIQITRVDPSISRYLAASTYSIYDPVFQSGYQHIEATTPGDTAGGDVRLPNQNTQDNFDLGLGGELPFGLRYDMGFETSKRHNENFVTREVVDINGMTNLVNVLQPNDDYASRVGIDLTQPLLRDFWISPTRSQIQISRRTLRISEKQLEFVIMGIVRDVNVAYYDLVESIELVRVRQKAVELARQLLDENKKRVEAGVLAPLDEKQAEAEVARTQSDLLLTQATVIKRENTLKNLISDNFERWEPIRLTPAEKLLAAPMIFNKPDSWANALERRPDFHQLKLQLEIQGIEVNVRYNQLFPALNLVGGYGRLGLDPDFDGTVTNIKNEDFPDHYYGVVLSVPLSRRGERNTYRAERERQRQLELQLKEAHQTIILGVENAIIDAETFYDQIPARRATRLFFEASVEAERKKLENGKSTSYTVQQLIRDLTDAQAAEVTALAAYNKALAEFHFQEGTILERNKIFIDYR